MVKNPELITTSESDGAMPKSYLLPAGTRVYLSSPAVHYHPKYWPDPLKLDPLRWTDGSPATVHGKEQTGTESRKVVTICVALVVDKIRSWSDAFGLCVSCVCLLLEVLL